MPPQHLHRQRPLRRRPLLADDEVLGEDKLPGIVVVDDRYHGRGNRRRTQGHREADRLLADRVALAFRKLEQLDEKVLCVLPVRVVYDGHPDLAARDARRELEHAGRGPVVVLGLGGAVPRSVPDAQSGQRPVKAKDLDHDVARVLRDRVVRLGEVDDAPAAVAGGRARAPRGGRGLGLLLVRAAAGQGLLEVSPHRVGDVSPEQARRHPMVGTRPPDRLLLLDDRGNRRIIKVPELCSYVHHELGELVPAELGCCEALPPLRATAKPALVCGKSDEEQNREH
mmetsp:Transcript_25194/g.72632  ORF Transcript_25194/g.72632 Transcript_25194/m.72632 type:complete len:283 (+) Transcript_25194:1205-2053(+)